MQREINYEKGITFLKQCKQWGLQHSLFNIFNLTSQKLPGQN